MEETNRQLIGEVTLKVPDQPGRPKRSEHQDLCYGTAQILVEAGPLTGRCHVEASERRTRQG